MSIVGSASVPPITTYYSPSACTRALVTCNDLSLSPTCSPATRGAARRDLMDLARPLPALLTNVCAVPLHPPVEKGWFGLNPSVALWRGRLHVIHRAANFLPVRDGHYIDIPASLRADRNYLCSLHADLTVNGPWMEVLPPRGETVRSRDPVPGLKDIRLFAMDEDLYGVASSHGRAPDFIDDMLVAQLTFGEGTSCRHAEPRRLSSASTRSREKNWTPLIVAGEPRFIRYFQDNVVFSIDGNEVSRTPSSLAVDHLRGGSQALPFAGGWLLICHEMVEGVNRRRYAHRFAWLDGDAVLRRLSEPFKLRGDDVEFVTGLAAHPDGRDLVISYGLSDCEGWLSRVPAIEVARLLHLH
ncbi:hypothetical protein OVY01_06905 [Robbsia sp. Bb-Pol-6]|uniref:Glycosidase n=1 Tax=Robbsia betulipollinis TaxID=2981849 RepID=A0ABT3ZKA6_9BURK|nr:hypothetical protein [Robbsia betulipollinis]MCY0386965.1 hypothetical protein [Robbsia betulipollinis]